MRRAATSTTGGKASSAFTVAAVVAAALAQAAVAGEPVAGHSSAVRLAQETPSGAMNFEIAAQPLSEALTALGAQSGLTIIVETELSRGIQATALSGRYTPDEALRRLLEPAGLKAEYLDSKTVAVRLAREKEASETSRTSYAAPTESFRLAQSTGSQNEERRSSNDGPAQAIAHSAALDQGGVLEEIVVTGTHIRGASPVGTSLIVLDRAYIEATGAATVPGFIEALPQNFALASQSATNVPGVSHSALQGSSINLRGIGEGTTLTLLNGRRMALGYLGRAADISALPVSALERVEVLVDSASATYGSDAVGGVVNFILRRDFEGFETSVRAGSADDVNEYRIAQAIGGAWSSGNALLSLEYYKRGLLRSGDRDFVPSEVTVGSLLPRDRNFSAMFSGRWQATDQVEAFADALYTHRDSYNESGQITFNDTADTKNPQLNATAGLAWQFEGGWRLEGSGAYGRNKLDQIQDSVSGALILNTLFEIETAEVKADGPLFALPAGNARLALGVHWRSESFWSVNEVQGIPSEAAEFDQTVRSVFGELYLPVVGEGNARPGVRRLEFSLAGRLDDYSTFGSSFDPRFGFAWEPVAKLRVRGSYGTSYVAPRLLDYDPRFDFAMAITLPDPDAPGGVSRQLRLAGTDVGNLVAQEAETWSLGIDVEPASGLQIGINYFRIDYENRIENPPLWDVMLSNPAPFASLITRNPTPDDVASAVAVGAASLGFYECDFVEFCTVADPQSLDPASIAVIVDGRRRNLSLTRTSGLDLALQYAFAAFGGEMQLSLNGTRIFEREQQVTAIAPAFDTVDTVHNPPDWRARGAMDFKRGGWSANLFVNHTDSYTDNRASLPQRVGSYTTVDVRLAHTFAAGETRLLSGLTIAASARNLFDRDPPHLAVLDPLMDMGFDPTNAHPLGRLVALDLVKIW